jgi:hypothetical protein
MRHHPYQRPLTIPEHDHAMSHIPLSDDELLARLLIDTWTLTTGRMLRSDVPPQELTEQELIVFWADDYFEPAEMPTAPGATGTAFTQLADSKKDDMIIRDCMDHNQNAKVARLIPAVPQPRWGQGWPSELPTLPARRNGASLAAETMLGVLRQAFTMRRPTDDSPYGRSRGET